MQIESTNTKHTEITHFNKALFKAKKIEKIILILKFIESKRLAKSHYDKMAQWFGVGNFTTECYCKINRSETSLSRKAFFQIILGKSPFW